MPKRLRVPQDEMLTELFQKFGGDEFQVVDVGFKPGMGSMMRGMVNAGALVKVESGDRIAKYRIHDSYLSKLKREALTA